MQQKIVYNVERPLQWQLKILLPTTMKITDFRIIFQSKLNLVPTNILFYPSLNLPALLWLCQLGPPLKFKSTIKRLFIRISILVFCSIVIFWNKISTFTHSSRKRSLLVEQINLVESSCVKREIIIVFGYYGLYYNWQ
jgi:hypothetical protein